MATETAGSQPNNTAPWEAHSDLYNERARATTKGQQNALAGSEHRAFAREVVSDNPLMVAPLLAAIPAYQGAKALGLTNSRSDPSIDQAAEAYKGVGEGLAAAIEPWKAKWNESVAKPIEQAVETAKQAVAGPWEKMWGSTSPPIQKAPVASPDRFETVFSSLVSQESGGKHTDAKGNLLTSPVGAQGITQVLPKTASDPGYGVQPLQGKSQDEYVRFGKDYLRAMLNEFGGDYKAALAAYNYGPAAVKKAMKSGGDWFSKMPQETKTYVNRILR